MTKLTNLKRVREQKVMTQAELALAAGLSARAVSMIERGESEPHPGTIRKIARALSCDPVELWDHAGA